MRTTLLCAALAAALASTALGCGEKKAVESDQKAPTTSEEQALEYGLTKEQASQVLVKVGDTTLTLGDFAERLGGQSPYLRARYSSPERRREFLENMVRFELLALEAQKRGFDKAGDVDRVRKQMMVQQMMEELFEKKGIQLSDIPDAEIEAYYKENTSEFDKPAQVRASHILIANKAVAEKVLAEAIASAEDMHAFRKLAEKYNEDAATKSAFGDLRYFSLTPDSGETDGPARPEAVRKAAFGLKDVGQVHPELVRSGAGFHIVKLTGKRDALKRSLEDARRLIQNRLWRKKREAQIEKFVGELRAKASIKENPDLLAKVKVKATDAPAMDLDQDSDEAAPAQEPK
jgi:peptidyl-prolyl cis-trans isomerase C